jgi:uncharacterized protein YbgA (DUF1722 family)/uncharacterized protein YbbK (DUF523 family)
VERIRVGISTCLLGERVRYDGGHKLDRYLTDTLGRYFEYAPVCPEVECGLPVPREAMHLTGDPAAPRLVTRQTGIDHTDRMQAWAAQRIASLRGEGLCGFIFRARSPSSGLFHVKCYNAAGEAAGTTVGIWARAFTQAFPYLPVEEDGRLNDPDLRENFIERVFACKRFRDEVRSQPADAANLQAFHRRSKLLLMAHAPAAVATLGRLVAELPPQGAEAACDAYERGFLAALTEPATVPRQVNVLQHMQGYFRDVADDGERRALAEAIADYARELIPLIVPITLFRYLIRKHNLAYLAEQTYLSPHPAELKLRNHA